MAMPAPRENQKESQAGHLSERAVEGHDRALVAELSRAFPPEPCEPARPCCLLHIRVSAFFVCVNREVNECMNE